MTAGRERPKKVLVNRQFTKSDSESLAFNP